MKRREDAGWQRALITGGSKGIGAGFARELAARGTELVLVARTVAPLEELASELRASHKVAVETLPADLTEMSDLERVEHRVAHAERPVDLLINNAGFGKFGEFPFVDKQRLLQMVQVNCAAVVHLTHLYLREMTARRRGDILILASTASFQAVPYISTYAATKAFDLLFAEGLAEEMKPYGIRVCALCPGSTQSEFHAVAGQEKFIHRAETAQKVARTGLRALAAGKSYVISGLGNYLGAHGERLVPRRLVTRTAARMFKPKEKNQAGN